MYYTLSHLHRVLGTRLYAGYWQCAWRNVPVGSLVCLAMCQKAVLSTVHCITEYWVQGTARTDRTA